MLGTDIALKHQMATMRYNELLAEAARQRAADHAVAARRHARRTLVAEIRTAIALALLRAGSWLMPEDRCGRPINRGFELRPGQ
jgi:hypothetical protein